MNSAPWRGIKYALAVLMAWGPISPVMSHGAETGDNSGSDCDLAIEVVEPDFCVIQGKVYDLDLNLVPMVGVCGGTTTLTVGGFPSGVTHKILPSPKIKLTEVENKVTVRVDTASMKLKERSTVPLDLKVTHEGHVYAEQVDMTIDLPVFDFSLQPETSQLRLFQDETVSVPVGVKLLGAACQEPPPVRLSLNRSSSPLSFTLTHEFDPDSVVPPEETTLFFTAASVPEIGSLKATLIGCCTSDNKERTAVMNIEILPALPDSLPNKDESGESLRKEDPRYEDLVDQDEKVKVDSLENIITDLKLPSILKEEAEKSVENEAKRGYRPVAEGEIQTFKRLDPLAPSMSQVVWMLTFEPSSLSETPFAALRSEGAYTAGSPRDGKWTAVVQRFMTPEGIWVELTEEDIVTSGGMENIMAKEGVDLYIHGFPATLVVQQSPSGQALSRTSWQTKSRAYHLRMEGDVKADPSKKAFFLALAQSLPE